MIQVIHRALDIMENVAKAPIGPKLLSHIANDLELNQATCANIVKTLLTRNYLKRAENEKGYLLGDKLNEIINQPYIYKHLIEIADVEMDIISKNLNEDSLLVVLNGENRKIIYNKTCDLLVKVECFYRYCLNTNY
jgi:DNA-binding IclR family transcriptional regulator